MKYPDDYINKIICGDALEVMKEIPDNIVDLIITSPPFNLGNAHHTRSFKHEPYADDMPEEEYQKWQIDVLNELNRICFDSCFYQHKNRIKDSIQITPYEWIRKTKWIVKQELVWFNGSPNFDKCRFYPMTERVYWLVKKKESKFVNNINHHDLFKWPSVGTGDKEIHKRAFPESMCLDIIQCFPSDYIILDPFVGSGTMAVAARILGRKFIGIDISEKYCKMARRRLEYKKQLF